MINGSTKIRYVGEKRYISIDLTKDLDTAQTISTVTWTPDTGVTLVAGSEAVSSDSKKASAKFDTPTAGTYNIVVRINTINPVEDPIIWPLTVEVKSLPD
jgi:hypothetical protein